ncbi:MAG: hypothetical protein M1276_02140 [Deltaproteobacteria bacterium]|jgi:hypothetical protein|nr:hypothetical protein [Deltaproteobacteria bacterium]
MLSKEEKSFREKRSDFRHRIVDGIYDKIPVDVVEHLGNANKELIFAIEGVFNGFVKRIDDRIAKTKERRSKTGGGKTKGDDENND